MATFNIDGKTTSISHVEMWSDTSSGGCAYIRYRAGTLEIRLADKWTEDKNNSKYISEDDAHTVHKVHIDEGSYSELKQRYDDWDDVLEGQPYSISPPQF